MPESIKPVIVIGLARTGTTGLVNMIHGQFESACLSHTLHYGAHEVKPIYNSAYWGDLKADASWSNFIEDYKTSDAFRLSQLNPDRAGELRGDDFIDFIFNLMDAMTTARSLRSWVMKVEPDILWLRQGQVFLDKLYKRYGPVAVLVPRRLFLNYLNSYLSMPGKSMVKRRNGLGFIVALMLGGARFGYFWRNIEKLAFAGHRTEVIEFEHIKNGDEEILSGLGKRYSLKRRKIQLKAPLRNSSRTSINDAPGRVAVWFARICGSRFTASVILWGFFKVKKRSKPLSYRLLLLDQDPERLKEQLVASGDTALIDML